ncbi:MAG: hypothetical protein HYV09_26915 [Deltaproteobacteria bacterium]|nr:hypothetical protein [Deltaproteobacteria bacterium]
MSVPDDGPVTLKMFAWSPETSRWIAHGGGFVARLHEVVSARVEIVASLD